MVLQRIHVPVPVPAPVAIYHQFGQITIYEENQEQKNVDLDIFNNHWLFIIQNNNGNREELPAHNVNATIEEALSEVFGYRVENIHVSNIKTIYIGADIEADIEEDLTEATLLRLTVNMHNPNCLFQCDIDIF
jgi:hypothetical protein